MSEKALKKLASHYHLKVDQIRELLELLAKDYSAPYILRYRKDVAANLTVDDLHELRKEERRLYRLEKERKRIRSRLQDQDVLTDELEQNIESADSVSELIDYYVPYRPRKRARSRHALAQGLAPLAQSVLTQDERLPLMSEAAEDYVDPEVGLDGIGDVLDGVFHVVSDWMAEEKSHRDKQRDVLYSKGELVSKASGRGKGKHRNEFRDYMNFSTPVSDVHPYHVLCMMRGKRLNVLRYGVEPPIKRMFREAADLYLRGGAEQFNEIDVMFRETDEPPEGEDLGELSGPEFLYWCIRYSLTDTLAPILTRELEKRMRRDAEDLAVDIVRRNLRSRLMRRPVNDGPVMGVVSGLRTGCKIAVADQNGTVQEKVRVYPHTPRNEKEAAVETIRELVEKHDISRVAIGEGTATRQTEDLFAEIIQNHCPDLRFTVLDDEAADEYAGSNVANKELPGVRKAMRTAAFLARQIVDPLRELAKVDLRNLCRVRYAEDIDSKVLRETLEQLAEECVGLVGPDLNDASTPLLSHVPGLDRDSAHRIAEHRDKKGGFKRRRHVRDVEGIDEDQWRRSVGFVRLQDSDTPLDNTRIHPEHYVVAETMLKQLGVSSDDLDDEEVREDIANRRGEVKFAALEKQFDVHYLLLKDILDELVHPWPDPRMHQEERVFRQKPLRFDDLEPLQVLRGTVRKVVDFGAFVDVGVKEDGLVHISEMSDEFVHSPYDVLSVGDQIKVRVVEVDPERRRIALTMRSEEAAKKAAKRKAKAREEAEKREEERRRRKEKAKEVPDADLPSSVGQARSNVGKKSRRMQKLEQYGKEGQDAKKSGEERKDEEAKSEDAEETKEEAESGDLLDKLQFASVEKRGEEK
ncbi:MAG: S1 RNA-binding domain-containing protein [Candidatus Brocadiia bacterium]